MLKSLYISISPLNHIYSELNINHNDHTIKIDKFPLICDKRMKANFFLLATDGREQSLKREPCDSDMAIVEGGILLLGRRIRGNDGNNKEWNIASFLDEQLFNKEDRLRLRESSSLISVKEQVENVLTSLKKRSIKEDDRLRFRSSSSPLLSWENTLDKHLVFTSSGNFDSSVSSTNKTLSVLETDCGAVDCKPSDFVKLTIVGGDILLSWQLDFMTIMLC